MSREAALARAEALVDSGEFFDLLAARVAYQTESQVEGRGDDLKAYLVEDMAPYLEKLGFTWRLADNPAAADKPFLIAQRIEDESLPTLLTYGHGDTVRAMDGEWFDGLEPWKLIRRGEKWYGRGAADNKGQHSVNLAALACVLAEKGSLGLNAKVIIELGEEAGSPGLHQICRIEKQALAADVLIASDGPRFEPDRPTIYGGSRGVFNFDLKLDLREGGHHSGNWGGLLANPGIILANAIASLINAQGRILVPGLMPEAIPPSVKAALAELNLTGKGGPKIDPQWGQPGLTAAEKVLGWNSLEVLAFECGNPAAPTHAIPPSAWARMHIRFTADTNPEDFAPAVRRHLDEHGFQAVEVIPQPNTYGSATRMLPDDPWIRWATASVTQTEGEAPAFMPNLGGTLPNDAFSDILGLPTIWVPHSYGGCSQHAPNEHVLESIMRQGLRIMTGLVWDLAENSPARG